MLIEYKLIIKYIMKILCISKNIIDINLNNSWLAGFTDSEGCLLLVLLKVVNLIVHKWQLDIYIISKRRAIITK